MPSSSLSQAQGEGQNGAASSSNQDAVRNEARHRPGRKSYGRKDGKVRLYIYLYNIYIYMCTYMHINTYVCMYT